MKTVGRGFEMAGARSSASAVRFCGSKRGDEFKTSSAEMDSGRTDGMNHGLAHTEPARWNARVNCPRLSVPFQANPIIRNETASFYGLVRAYLFIRARAPLLLGVETRRGADTFPSFSYPSSRRVEGRESTSLVSRSLPFPRF